MLMYWPYFRFMPHISMQYHSILDRYNRGAIIKDKKCAYIYNNIIYIYI